MHDNRFSKSLDKSILLFLGVFVCLMVFFVVLHPMTLISGDDWIGISSYRGILPKWHGFNPSKVLPETLFPASGVLASIVSKMTGVGYLKSVSLIAALFVSITATAFLYQLYTLLLRTYKASSYAASAITLFVLMALFFMFKTLPFDKSTYLLWEINITCYYHYVIPALLNSTVVMHLMCRNKTKPVGTCQNVEFCNAILFIAIYFAIFSNVFASIILAVYCGLQLLSNFIEAQFNIKETLKKNSLYISILLMWLLSLFFEANGQRAASIGQHQLEIAKSFEVLLRLLRQIDTFYAIGLAVAIVSGIFLSIRKSNSAPKKDIITAVASSVIVGLGLVLISSKASPAYAERPVAMFGIFFYLLLAFSIAMSIILVHIKAITFVIPVVFVVLLAKAFAYNSSLMNPHNLNLDYETSENIGNYIIAQAVAADRKGVEKAVIHVPVGDSNDNWPWPMYMGDSISKTLRLNGIIKNNISISVLPDATLNEKFRIPAAK